jgi:hypothetical protein
MLFLVTMPPPRVWVPHAMFMLHAHVPLVSLATRLGFHMLGLLPW